MTSVVIGFGGCGSRIAACADSPILVLVGADTGTVCKEAKFIKWISRESVSPDLNRTLENLVSERLSDSLHVFLIACPGGTAGAHATLSALALLRKRFNPDDIRITTLCVLPHRVMLAAIQVENIISAVPEIYDQSDHIILVDNSKIPGKSFSEINKIILKAIEIPVNDKLTILIVSGTSLSLCPGKACTDLLKEFASRTASPRNELSLLLKQLFYFKFSFFPLYFSDEKMIHLDILAGKMNFDGKKVSPDTRKGLLRLVIDEAADVLKIQWMDRETNKIDGEWNCPVTLETVPSVKTDKVFVIKPEIGEKQFIWIQQTSSNAAGDAAGFSAGSVDNIEALINQIQMFAQMGSGREAAQMYHQVFGENEEEEPIGEDQMLIDLGHHHHDHDDEDEDDDLDYEALMEQLLQGAGETAELPEQVLALMLMNPEIQQEVFANFIWLAATYLVANPGSSTTTEAPAATSQLAEGATLEKVPVSAVIKSEESLATLTADQEKINRLLALCPEGDADLLAVLRSPQFTESLKMLTEAVYSDQIAVLFTSLGLDINDVDPGVADPFEALCKALETKFSKH